MRSRSMIERPQFVIAYWLLPDAPARDFFREIIRRLATQFDGPLFEPHLTLAIGPDSAGEPEHRLAGLTIGAVEVGVVGLAFTAKFTKNLFVRFEASPGLLQLRASLGLGEEETFDPHLSLLYKNLPEEEQARLASEIQLPFTTVTFDAVAATRCRVPVTSAAEVTLWESLAARQL